MRSENVAKNCPKCCQIARMWTGYQEIVVAEKDGGKRFTAAFNADVILRMRRELYVTLRVFFSAGPYTILANNSICLDRSAINVV